MACSFLSGSASSNCLIDPPPRMRHNMHTQSGVQIRDKILSIDHQTVAGLSLSDAGMRMGGAEGPCERGPDTEEHVSVSHYVAV